MPTVYFVHVFRYISFHGNWRKIRRNTLTTKCESSVGSQPSETMLNVTMPTAVARLCRAGGYNTLRCITWILAEERNMQWVRGKRAADLGRDRGPMNRQGTRDQTGGPWTDRGPVTRQGTREQTGYPWTDRGPIVLLIHTFLVAFLNGILYLTQSTSDIHE